MRTNDFNYSLPQDLIAQTPLKNRHDSRLMIYERDSETIQHSHFIDIKKYLLPGDLLVINNTKVIPARIYGKKETGGEVEILLLKKINQNRWEALIGGKKMVKGKKIFLNDELSAVVVEEFQGPSRIIDFNKPVELFLDSIGNVPLPPYIHEILDDPQRYQTIYAQHIGSAAAPTAGLHFSKQLIDDLVSMGIKFANVTLHVGLDTFAPVTEDLIEDHTIHREWCEITQSNAQKINDVIDSGNKVIAVGTTSARTLETAAVNGKIHPFSGLTDLFIVPGYQFKIVDGLLTNFHLPKSTLLMMVSAFGGLKNIKTCYREAIKNKYRFYSFGDAMLIL